jgi:hypothetical protein
MPVEGPPTQVRFKRGEVRREVRRGKVLTCPKHVDCVPIVTLNCERIDRAEVPGSEW